MLFFATNLQKYNKIRQNVLLL